MGQGGSDCRGKTQGSNQLINNVMGSGHLFGWESVGEDWVKVACNPSGELLIDPSLILEDDPTDDELEKAPTSNWAFDHDANVSAHHVKYTDADSRSAIGDLLNSSGVLLKKLLCGYYQIDQLQEFRVRWSAADTRYIDIKSTANSARLRVVGYVVGGGAVNTEIAIFYGGGYHLVTHGGNFQSVLDNYLEDAPTNGVVNKAPTSNWAYDHNANASAHHAKYTDAAAQVACNLDGDLYHSFPGTAFHPTNPDTDQHHYGVSGKLISDSDGMSVYAPVMLPDGCTVTACLVDGSAGLTDEYWTLWRITHSDQTNAIMGQTTVQTEDTSISNAVIDNSLYSYMISVISMDTADELYYARIKYTL